MQMPKRSVDVNVHPQKKHVVMSDQNHIIKKVFESFKNKLVAMCSVKTSEGVGNVEITIVDR